LQFGQIYYLSSSFSSIANFDLWESCDEKEGEWDFFFSTDEEEEETNLFQIISNTVKPVLTTTSQ
jgi:hypothetical protein